MVSFDTAGESHLHQQVQLGLSDLVKAAIQNLAATIDHEEIRGRLQNVRGTGTAQIVLPGGVYACPDFAFTEVLPVRVRPVLPSLVCEIC